MMSEPGLQTITIHALPSNRTLKFDQVIEYNKRNIFLQNYTENEIGILFPDFFLFSKKLYMR